MHFVASATAHAAGELAEKRENVAFGCATLRGRGLQFDPVAFYCIFES